MPPIAPSQPNADAGAATILARASRADAADARRLAAAIEDVFLPADARLSDQVRALVSERLAFAVTSIENEVATFAATGGGRPLPRGVLPRLTASGLLRDPALMAELIARARQDLLAEALRRTVSPTDRSDLLGRLIECPDGIVAAAASAMLAAENRGGPRLAGLSRPVHHRMVWWVAAALRERASEDVDWDSILAEAAERCIDANARADSLDSAAMQLAAAIDPRGQELADVLVGSLVDARPALFCETIAHAASLAWDDASAIVLDPDGDRLWMVLRALGLGRADIARIGLLLADADPRRDLEAFTDALDSIAAIEQDVATAAIAPMRLHPEFRAALRALGRTPS